MTALSERERRADLFALELLDPAFPGGDGGFSIAACKISGSEVGSMVDIEDGEDDTFVTIGVRVTDAGKG